jgi:pyridoxal phosphate enzyme (YggS family)
MEEIADALLEVRKEIPANATLIVVTKTFPLSDVEILYQLGERNFGENRDEEGAMKSAAIRDDALWHFQGGIQSKKIRSIVSWADLIHSLDNLSHARKIDEVARLLTKRQEVLIQINLDPGNENRSGIDIADFEYFASEILGFKNLNLKGVMGVAPLGVDPSPSFALLQEKSIQLRNLKGDATYISAGMSGDFPTALRYGATHIRIGSSILGSR